MITKRIPGGWYADALPDGQFVVRLTDRYGLETHHGLVSFPLGTSLEPDFGGLLFPRLDPSRDPIVFRVMGQAQSDEPDRKGAWEWDARLGYWQRLTSIAKGVSPCIYGKDGARYISDAGAAIGSQGYRYIDDAGRPVTGDESLGPRDGITLYEWTSLGDGYFIGQGPKDGAWLRSPDGRYRKVIDGTTLCIRASRDGDHVAIACYLSDGRRAIEAVLIWATFDELLALPSVDAPPPDVPTLTVPDVPETFAPGAVVGFMSEDDSAGKYKPGCVPDPYVGVVSWGRVIVSDPVEAERIAKLPIADMFGMGFDFQNRPVAFGLLTTEGGTDLGPAWDALVQKQIEGIKAAGAGAGYIHEDNQQTQFEKANRAAELYRAADVLPISGFHALGNQSPKDLAPAYDGISLNIRSLHYHSEQHLMDTVEAAFRLLASGRAKVLFVTNWRTCTSPRVRAWILDAVQRVPPPALFPGQRPVVVNPAPLPSQPPVVVSHGRAGDAKDNDKAVVIATASVAAGSFFAWLFPWLKRRRDRKSGQK